MRSLLHVALPAVLALPALLALAGDAAARPAGDGGGPDDGAPETAALRFGPREAEHLLSRAGWGGTADEVAAAVAAGPEATVDVLLAGEPRRPFFAVEHHRLVEEADGRMLDDRARRDLRRLARRRDRAQLHDFTAAWVERMVAGEEPLRERLTLFWHGHFATSQEVVKSSAAMVRQNELLYEHALGSFEELLRAVLRDPALLVYLDADQNRVGHPNENLARELLELFTLGEGRYGEEDVREAARALTGRTHQGGAFRVRARDHDAGEKTVLGVTGRLDGDDLVTLLLADPACARHVAGELVAWLEGVPPDPARLDAYAAFLAANGWDVERFLRRLLLDPAFYRDEVVGARVAGPVELLVGHARRLGVDPPGELVALGARALGQHLFHPPSVAGWDEGLAWVDTASLMLRGSLAGVLVGTVTPGEVVELGALKDADAEAERAAEMADAAPDGPSMDGSSVDGPSTDDAAPDGAPRAERPRARPTGVPDPPGRDPRRRPSPLLRGLDEVDWRPRPNLTARLAARGAATDREVADALCDELLATPAPDETRRWLRERVRAERRALGRRDGRLLADPQESEPALLRVAHALLALPEAQLH